MNAQIIRNADLEELRELGAGRYGTVYHGKWKGSDVAIKRIKKSCFSGRSSEQERLVSIRTFFIPPFQSTDIYICLNMYFQGVISPEAWCFYLEYGYSL